MTWSDHFQKYRESYVTVGSILGAGLAGGALAYASGDCTADGFNTGINEWDELPRRVRVPIGGTGAYVVFAPSEGGRSTGLASSRRR